MEKNPEKTKLFKKICRLAGQAVQKYRMIADGDRILVGLSGGKDSFMLMHVLEALRRKAPVDFTLEAVTFDPGFEGFNADLIAEYCQHNGWAHHIVKLSVKDLLEEKAAEQRPCMLCSRLRRGNLYTKAEELNCRKIALGHNLDDIAVSLLIGLFRGQGLTTMGPNVPTDERDLRVIRPLAFVPEAMVVDAACEFEFPVAGECVYKAYLDEKGDRAYFMNLLDQLEQRIPNVRQQMLSSMSDVRPSYLLDPRFIDFTR
jgi:tRNA 2-thiocytidine biosynthesis protein TtcA